MPDQPEMTRRSALATSGAAVGLSALAQLAGAAQEKAEKGQFITVTPGFTLLRTWEVGGTEYPQIAILELTGEAHHEYHKDPKAFVNKHKVFPKPVEKWTFSVQVPNDDRDLFSGKIAPRGCKASSFHTQGSNGG